MILEKGTRIVTIFTCHTQHSGRTESACNARDLSSIPGEGNAYPLQYSGLDNYMDDTVHWVTKRHD